jgi:hypothetical protein
VKIFGEFGVAALVSVAMVAGAQATPLSFWAANGWTQFANDVGMAEGPGAGGQSFDAEYFYYKSNGTTLEIGLQTGFDVLSGHQMHSTKSYYAGDLALSFDGSATQGGSATYEYGIDFGLLTRGYSGADIDMGTTPTSGVDNAGLYNTVTWDNDIISSHGISAPYALDDGTFDRALLSNNAFQDGSHFVRTVSFDSTGLGNNVDVHWTMSCGNDNINGGFDNATAPEPGMLALLSLGLLRPGSWS